MKKILIGLLFNFLVDQINAAAVLGRRAALAASRFGQRVNCFHDYRDIIGTLVALPDDRKDISPIHGAVAIVSGDLQAWQQQENRKKLFESLFHERDNIIYPTVAIGNPTSSLEPKMLGTFISMICTPSFNFDTFLTSDFVKQWHAVHLKKTGRYKNFTDFKKQVKNITKTLITADKTDQKTALAAATCLKFPTREELEKVFSSYKDIDLSKFNVKDRFSNETTLDQAKQLLEKKDFNYTPEEIEKITFLALKSREKGINDFLYAPFEHANYKGNIVPCCVEVALRTFINTILVDPKTNLLSIDSLPQGINLNPDFKKFIEKHKDPSVQNYYRNSKDDWLALTSGKSTIKYIKGDTEMKSEMHNSLAFLNHCFGTHATTLAEFGKLLSTNTKKIVIDEKNNTYGDYNIVIKTAYQTFNSLWSFSTSHVKYSLEKTKKIDFSRFNLLRLSKIKIGGSSLLNVVPKDQKRSIFERTVNSNLYQTAWTFDHLKEESESFGYDLASFLFEDESNFLHKAFQKNRLDLIEPLIAAGINIKQKNHRGDSPLMYAIGANSPESVKLLVQLGVNIRNEKNLFSYLTTKHTEDTRSMIETLVNLGVNPKESDDIIFSAVKDNNASLIKNLAEVGINLSKREKSDGVTPIHRAIKSNHLDVARLLAELGADINAVDNIGRTPLKYAILQLRGDDHRFVDELRAMGAREHETILQKAERLIFRPIQDLFSANS